MSNDLISRSALLDGGIKVREGLNRDGLVFIPMRDVRQSIKDAPTIDPEELRPKGRWKRENNRPKSYLYKCSACGKIAYFCGMKCGYTYCPNCGAKMEDDHA